MIKSFTVPHLLLGCCLISLYTFSASSYDYSQQDPVDAERRLTADLLDQLNMVSIQIKNAAQYSATPLNQSSMAGNNINTLSTPLNMPNATTTYGQMGPQSQVAQQYGSAYMGQGGTMLDSMGMQQQQPFVQNQFMMQQPQSMMPTQSGMSQMMPQGSMMQPPVTGSSMIGATGTLASTLFGVSTQYGQYWGPNAQYANQADIKAIKASLEASDSVFASNTQKAQIIPKLVELETIFMRTNFVNAVSDPALSQAIFDTLQKAYDCVGGGLEKAEEALQTAAQLGTETKGARMDKALGSTERPQWEAVARVFTAAVNNWSFCNAFLIHTSPQRDAFYANYFQAMRRTPVARRAITNVDQLTGRNTYFEDPDEAALIKSLESIKSIISSSLSRIAEGQFMIGVRAVTGWITKPDTYNMSIGLQAYISYLFFDRIADRLGWTIGKGAGLDDHEYFIVAAECFYAMYSVNVSRFNYTKTQLQGLPQRNYQLPLNHLSFSGHQQGTFFNRLNNVSSTLNRSIQEPSLIDLFRKYHDKFGLEAGTRPALTPKTNSEYLILAICSEACSYIRDGATHGIASELLGFMLNTLRADTNKQINTAELSNGTMATNVVHRTIARIEDRLSFGATSSILKVTINITGDYNRQDLYASFFKLMSITTRVRWLNFSTQYQAEFTKYLNECTNLMTKRGFPMPVIPPQGTWGGVQYPQMGIQQPQMNMQQQYGYTTYGNMQMGSNNMNSTPINSMSLSSMPMGGGYGATQFMPQSQYGGTLGSYSAGYQTSGRYQAPGGYATAPGISPYASQQQQLQAMKQQQQMLKYQTEAAKAQAKFQQAQMKR